MSTSASKGFLRPTTTPTPDELFDVWLPVLSGAALKVLLYIVRRTLGFKKDTDAISLSQLCRGIRTADGRILDQGTGLARNTAVKAIKELVELGLVVVERSQDERGIHEINCYRLRFRDGDGDENNTSKGVGPKQDQGGERSEPGMVGHKSHQGSSKRPPRVGRKTNPQQTVIQETVLQQTEPPLPPPGTSPAPGQPDKTSSVGAGGGDTDFAFQPLEQTHLSHKPPDVPAEHPAHAPDEQEEAYRQLVEFGVWQKRARHLVTSLNMTSEFALRACLALRAESGRGKHFEDLGAVLFSRLMEGWIPPELEALSEPVHEDISSPEEDDAPTMPQSQRKPLPPVIDSRAQEHDAYAWFSTLREQIRLTMPSEIFAAWLQGAELADISCAGPPKDNEMPTLTIRLANRYAYEWVSQRLHKNIQRLTDTVLGYHVDLCYTTPQLEQAGSRS